MVYDNKPRRNLFVDRKFRNQVCSKNNLYIYENGMLYVNKIFPIFFDIFSVDDLLLICQQKKVPIFFIFFQKKVMLTNLKILKKLCDLKNFLSNKCCFFPRLVSKKKKWTKNVHFFKKAKTLLEIVIYLMSLYIPIVGRHVGVYLIYVCILCYHISCKYLYDKTNR
jgi:hypothetical protein